MKFHSHITICPLILKLSITFTPYFPSSFFHTNEIWCCKGLQPRPTYGVLLIQTIKFLLPSTTRYLSLSFIFLIYHLFYFIILYYIILFYFISFHFIYLFNRAIQHWQMGMATGSSLFPQHQQEVPTISFPLSSFLPFSFHILSFPFPSSVYSITLLS